MGCCDVESSGPHIEELNEETLQSSRQPDPDPDLGESKELFNMIEETLIFIVSVISRRRRPCVG